MNKFVLSLALLAGIAPLQSAAAQDGAPQPSFDCAAATQPLEALICADAELAALDAEMAEAYRRRLAASDSAAEETLRLEQRAWSGNRVAACGVDGSETLDVEDAISCLTALYRARIEQLAPVAAAGNSAVPTSGYAWLMGEWRVTALRSAAADAERAAIAKGWVGRSILLAEAPIATLSGAACSFPRYRAQPAPEPEFGDLSQYPTAVMVRVSCVGVALLDVVRLSDDQMLLAEGDAILELERRR